MFFLKSHLKFGSKNFPIKRLIPMKDNFYKVSNFHFSSILIKRKASLPFRTQLSSISITPKILFNINSISSFYTSPSLHFPKDLYYSLVNTKKLSKDERQEEAIEVLHDLSVKLQNYDPPIPTEVLEDSSKIAFFERQKNEKENKKDGFMSFFSIERISDFSSSSKNKSKPVKSKGEIIKGIYLWGGVGIGKTMLMDMFYDSFVCNRKRRVHFHSFMLDVQKFIFEWRKEHGLACGDPIPEVARRIATDSWLLCFDEFQVNDVADALILRRLFGFLFDYGCIVVATSNRPPEDLYKDGLNRSAFLPFIDLLKEHCIVWNLDKGGVGVDYRMRTKLIPKLYNSPLNENSARALDEFFSVLTKDAELNQNIKIPVMQGRELTVPVSSGKVCRFSFADLCINPLGAADYLAIAQNFHTVIISDIPRMYSDYHQNQARRFITLIDILYENNIRLACSAETMIVDLFKPVPNDSHHTQVHHSSVHHAHPSDVIHDPSNHSLTEWSDKTDASIIQEMSGRKDIEFAFDRTVSRLIEMQSEEYWKKHTKVHMKN